MNHFVESNLEWCTNGGMGSLALRARHLMIINLCVCVDIKGIVCGSLGRGAIRRLFDSIKVKWAAVVSND